MTYQESVSKSRHFYRALKTTDKVNTTQTLQDGMLLYFCTNSSFRNYLDEINSDTAGAHTL